MTKITIEIKSCQDCPKFKKERFWTEDSWELAFDWFCESSNHKKIQGYVEWHEEKSVQIPTWCPLKIQNNV